MVQPSNVAITLQSIESPEGAGTACRVLIDDRHAQHAEALALVANHPVQFLTLFNETAEAMGLSDRAKAQAFDVVIGTIGDDKRSSEYVADVIAPQAQAQIMIATDELAGTVEFVMTAEALVHAFAQIFAEELRSDDDEGEFEEDDDDEPSLDALAAGDDDDPPSHRSQAADPRVAHQTDRVMAWASRARENPAYEQVLDTEFEPETIRRTVMIATWRWADCSDLSRPTGEFVEACELAGLDPSTTVEAMRELRHDAERDPNALDYPSLSYAREFLESEARNLRVATSTDAAGSAAEEKAKELVGSVGF